ncbi:MAG: dTDP-4-dehydrorhamnose 3,5-epimerase [Pseudomonadota bacterium]
MSLDVQALDIPDVKLVTPKRFGDQRGFFSETYNKERFVAAGISANFIQDNHSLSASKGTIRGLHYQRAPFAQAKLVRVLRGSIIDVAVDFRAGSPSFGKWVRAELSAENGVQIFVPRGFLHGFATLEENTEIAYKVDNYYSAECDGSVAWDDPFLSIDWGVSTGSVVVSEKDARAPLFKSVESPFKM